MLVASHRKRRSVSQTSVAPAERTPTASHARPLSWLRDFAPFDGTAAELGDALSNLGLVVDGISEVGHGLDGVVVARIEDVRAHPDADRIRLVDVDAGTGNPLQIVCGASNLHVGDLVALASVGTTLPGGVEIARRKMRGQWSEGMISASDELDPSGELGLPGATADREILVLPPGVAEPGRPLAAALDIQPDVVFDLDVTPNRPDALCMAGVARDLAAALGLPFSFPDPGALPAAEPELAAASLRVDAPELCPRLTATVVTNLPQGPAPPWLARRLALAGMRPISAVVDATNYVMLDLGQPVHAYDLDRLPGRGLLVRGGRPGETMVTLDDIERPLDPEDCVIADAEGGAVGIGGIMGGASSEVSAATTTVLLEAAWFAPQAIARTGNRLGLTSEARARFERGVDPAVAARAAARFVSLLPGCRRGVTDDVVSPAHLPVPAAVALRTDRVNAILGTTLDDATVAGYLRPLGFEVTAAGAGVADVIVPSWRPDTEREIDVIEEVARLHGYARIERTLPPGIRTGGGLTRRQQQRRGLRDVLAGAGLSEAWTTTFLAPDDLARAELTATPVEVANPLDQAESILRPSLMPGLLKAVHHNAARQLGDVRLFEVGRVFLAPGAGGRMVTARAQWPRAGRVPGDRRSTRCPSSGNGWRSSWPVTGPTPVWPPGSGRWSPAPCASKAPGSGPPQLRVSTGVAARWSSVPTGAPSARWGRSTPTWPPATRFPGGSATSKSISTACSPCPAGPSGPPPPAATRPAPSTWPSSWPAPSPPPRWRTRCATPEASCWNRSDCSTSTRCPTGPAPTGRGAPAPARGRAASPTASASGRRTGP